LKLNKEIELSCKYLGREFYAVRAEKPKLRFSNLFVHTRGISSWPDVEDRREYLSVKNNVSLCCVSYRTEHVMSIVASLLKNCDGPQRLRLLNKFVENDHEKVDRLMELHFKYLEKVHATDEIIERQKRVGPLHPFPPLQSSFYSSSFLYGLFN